MRVSNLDQAPAWNAGGSWSSVVALIAMSLAGCHVAETCDRRCYVNREITERAYHPLGTPRTSDDVEVPPTVILEDGLDEEECIALALWNNAAYQELLTQLGISRAQAVEAGLLTDPQYTILFPVGPKQLEFTAQVAIEAIYLRPIRKRAAEFDLSRVAEQMVQGGLNLMRDARVAHANVVLAQKRAELAEEALTLRNDIKGLTERRLEAGDIGGVEVATAQVDAVLARLDITRFEQNTQVAREQLRMLTGLGLTDFDLDVWETFADPPKLDETPDELVHRALAFRPDLRAAEYAIENAGVRAGLERKACLRISAMVDSNQKGEEGFEMGPGLQGTIPIFNGNRGQIALADANLQQAIRAYMTVRDRIALEVRTACYQLEQAEQNLVVVERELLPRMDTAATLARRNYEEGEASYFLVLQTTGQFLDVRVRYLELQADLRRAVAELERSVGHRFLTRFDVDEEIELEVPPVPPEDGDDDTSSEV